MTMVEEPVGGRSTTVDVDGPLHVVDYGGAGPPLVLVHGLGGSHLNWMLVARPLTESFRVVAVDLPGFGLTAPEGRSADVRSQAQLLTRYISQELGGPAFVAGNSMGGLVALLAADHDPSVISGLVLLDPALPPDKLRIPTGDTMRHLGLPLLPGIGESIMRRLRDGRTVEEHVSLSLGYVAADPSRLPPEVITAGHAMEEARRRMPWSISSFVDAGRSIASVFARRDRFKRMLHGIGAPVLLIHGTDDEVVPIEHARAIAGERPDWTFKIYPNTGHVPQLERPSEVVDAITAWASKQVFSIRYSVPRPT